MSSTTINKTRLNSTVNINQIKSLLIKSNDRYSSIKKKLESELNKCTINSKKSNQDYQVLIQTVSNEKNNLNKNLENCKNNLKKVNQRILAYEAQSNVRYKKIQESTKKIEELELKILEYEKQLHKNINLERTEDAEKINNKIIEYEEKLTQQKTLKRILEEELYKINNDLNNEKNENRQLTNKLQEIKDSLTEKNEELVRCTEQNNNNIEQINNYKNAINEEKRRVETLSTKIQEQTNQLNNLDENNINLNNELSSLKNSSWLQCLNTKENALSCIENLIKRYPNIYPLPIQTEQKLLKASSPQVQGVIMNNEQQEIKAVVVDGQIQKLTPSIPLSKYSSPQIPTQPPLPIVSINPEDKVKVEKQISQSDELDRTMRNNLLVAIKNNSSKLKTSPTCVKGLKWDSQTNQCVQELRTNFLDEIKTKGQDKLRNIKENPIKPKSSEESFLEKQLKNKFQGINVYTPNSLTNSLTNSVTSPSEW
jgi:myosin heavy subunit